LSARLGVIQNIATKQNPLQCTGLSVLKVSPGTDLNQSFRYPSSFPTETGLRIFIAEFSIDLNGYQSHLPAVSLGFGADRKTSPESSGFLQPGYYAVTGDTRYCIVCQATTTYG
jgi:hypothetical protein